MPYFLAIQLFSNHFLGLIPYRFFEVTFSTVSSIYHIQLPLCIEIYIFVVLNIPNLNFTFDLTSYNLTVYVVGPFFFNYPLTCSSTQY